MTNYKQPHKPMTTIEEIVETNNDWVAKVLFAKPGKDTEKAVFDHNEWLTQTLKDYDDAVRAEGYDKGAKDTLDIVEIVIDANKTEQEDSNESK